MLDHIDYDPTSSTFFRYNTTVGTRAKAGAEAGSIKNSKYCKRIELTSDRIQYTGSRVAWFKLHGVEVPEGRVVVPLDGSLLNLSKENLRLMTWRQQRIYVSMTKGCKSCAIRPNKDGTFRSYFIVREKGNRTCETLGTFETEHEAIEAYRRKQMQVFFEENQ